MSEKREAAMAAMGHIKRMLRDRMMRKHQPESMLAKEVHGEEHAIDEVSPGSTHQDMHVQDKLHSAKVHENVHDDENHPPEQHSDPGEGLEHEERLEGEAVEHEPPTAKSQETEHEPVMEEKRTVLESFVPKRSHSGMRDMPTNLPHHGRRRGRPPKNRQDGGGG